MFGWFSLIPEFQTRTYWNNIRKIVNQGGLILYHLYDSCDYPSNFDEFDCKFEDTTTVGFSLINPDKNKFSTTTDRPRTTEKVLQTKDIYTEDPTFCQEQENGLYSHLDCSKYYHCYNSGNQVVSQCGDGTFFLESIQNCDWEENVDCVNVKTTDKQKPTEKTKSTLSQGSTLIIK